MARVTFRSVGWEVVRLLRAADDAEAKANLVRHLHAAQDVPLTPLQVQTVHDVHAAVDPDTPLTKQELEWIVATRDAAAARSLPCTNTELVQLAIVTKGDTAKALSRLQKMAAWTKDLRLDEISFEDAFRAVNEKVFTSGYGMLTPYGRAQSGSIALGAWYSVRTMHNKLILCDPWSRTLAEMCLPGAGPASFCAIY